jgi:hypothetical protein
MGLAGRVLLKLNKSASLSAFWRVCHMVLAGKVQIHAGRVSRLAVGTPAHAAGAQTGLPDRLQAPMGMKSALAHGGAIP